MEEMILIAVLTITVLFFLLRPFVIRAKRTQPLRKSGQKVPVYTFHRPASGFEVNEQHPATAEF